MANDEDEKKPGDDEPKPQETILEQQRDPDEAVFAEQAILHYAHWALEQVQDGVVDAIDGFSNWVLSQADPRAFDDPAFFAPLGELYLRQMARLFGGHTPIWEHLFPQFDGAVDQAASQESEATLFIHQLAVAARDALWYLRDNLQLIVSNHWDALRDLAYEGSRDFVPVLHHLGLPVIDFDPTEIARKMAHHGEAFAKARPVEQEEAVKDAQLTPDPAQTEQAEEQQQLFEEEEGERKSA